LAFYRFSEDAFTTCSAAAPEMTARNPPLAVTMFIQSILSQTKSIASRFARHDGGNIAMTFAVALVPLLGFVGAAVDYSRVNAARSAMQMALDSAALMVSKDIGPSDLSASQITERANTYFAALYKNKDGVVTGTADVPAVTAVYTPSTGKGSTVKLDVTATVATDFMKIVGTPSMKINSVSVTNWGSVRLRVALVLDTTGSMGLGTGKIEALKVATTKLLAQLKASASKPEDVYVSIVPFSRYVNTNPTNYNANWIDWTGWLAEPPNGTSPRNSVNWKDVGPGSNCPYTNSSSGNSSHGFGCTDRPATDKNAQPVSKIPANGNICPSDDDGSKSRLRYGRLYNGCYNTTGSSGSYKHVWRPADSVSSPTPADIAATPAKSTWNGCVTERGLSTGPSNDYDRNVTAPAVGTTASLFPAEQNTACSPVMLPLGNSWDAMNTVVTNLYPLGGTNQPIGLVWGWQSLVGGGPFPTPPAKDANYEYRDIIVLMSDGLNTQNRWDGDGYTPEPNVDTRMYQSSKIGTCPNIWAEKITIFTVHVNTDNGTESALLKNCASTNKDTNLKEFQMVTTASGIGAAFDKIGTQLTKLRIAQ
jgi:Flp pilus assembly protein TadG